MMPDTPGASKLATMVVAARNSCLGTVKPPQLTVSSATVPLTEPDP